MKELMFLKELTLINQINQNSAWFLITGISKILVINLNHMFVKNVIIYQWWPINATKQPIALNLVNVNQMLSDKFGHSDEGFKYFIGYKEDNNIARSLCILLPETSGYFKAFR